MKKINRTLISVGTLAIFALFGLAGEVSAATAPNLGVAAGYSVFGNAGITETAGQMSHLWGNAGGNGLGNLSLIASQVDGTIDAGANVLVVGAISSAYGDLAGEALTGVADLATSPTVGPGVYDIAATTFNSTLTLDGAGVYIFRGSSSIAQTPGGTMNLINGADACNVFWQIPTSMTFSAVGNIEGTIITNTGLISFVSGVPLKGRAWAATQVTMDNNQITEPVCAPLPANLTVTKVVINDNGGTKVVADFPLFVGATSVVSGVANSFVAGAYAVTETLDATYTQTFSGDCDASGNINLVSGSNVACTVTNDDIVPPPPSSGGGGGSVRPRIHVEKVATPETLPNGSGAVMYDYTVTNIGSISINDIEVTDNKCDDLEFIGGDDDNDDRLDRDEEWTYQCSTTLDETTTNIVTATGKSSSGRSTQDTDEATVVVTQPVVPLPVVAVVTSVPRLPSTGVAPREGNPLANTLVPVGILGALIFLGLRKRQLN